MSQRNRFVLFDLDGTLVPLGRPRFEAALFENLDAMFRRTFPDRPQAVQAMKRASIACFHAEDGVQTNEQRLKRFLAEEAGPALAEEILLALDEHYAGDYNHIRECITDESIAMDALALVQRYGGTPVVATNPIAPASCIYARMAWVGLKPEQFALVTTYDKCHFTKPDPRYYLEVMELIGAGKEDCLMIGNDTDEDMEGAIAAGIEVYLMTDHVMDRRNSVEQYPHGTGREMLAYLEQFLMKGA